MRLNPSLKEAIEEVEGFINCKPGAFEREIANHPEAFDFLNDQKFFQRVHNGLIWDHQTKHSSIKGYKKMCHTGLASVALGLTFNLAAKNYGAPTIFFDAIYGTLAAGTILINEMNRWSYNTSSKMIEETKARIRSMLPPHELR